MKKIFSLFLIALLIISSVGPVPVGTAASFPGSVPIDPIIVGEDDKAFINTTITKGGYNITLHRRISAESQPQVSALPSYTTFKQETFPDKVEAGLYFVRATSTTDVNEVYDSIIFEVKPRPFSVGQGNVDIKSETDTPYEIVVNNVKGSEVRLYNNGNLKTPVDSQPSDNSNTITFTVEKAGSSYQVTQVINGAESVPSGRITVQPTDLRHISTKGSGATGVEGEIEVSGTKPGSTLEVYTENGNLYRTETAESTSHTIKRLPPGKYTIAHKENSVYSKNRLTSIEVSNQRIPLISLEGGENYELRYDIDSNHTVTRKKYVEPGFTVTDKNGTLYSGLKQSGYICANSTIIHNDPCGNDVILRVQIDSDIKDAGMQYTPPGKYTITYQVFDAQNTNLTSSLQRNVTVYPNKLNITKRDTNDDIFNQLDAVNRKTGEIEVHGVYPGATLMLYQRSEDGTPTVVPLSPSEVNEGSYTFKNVPVGNDYFAVQEFEGVASEPSAPVDIKDTTPPELFLNGDQIMKLQVGETFVDPGAYATDNIDDRDDITRRIQVIGTVDTTTPGVYKIDYRVSDNAGNALQFNAENHRRIVHVRPLAVTAEGSIATVAEVSVTNIFPGTTNQPTILILKKYSEVNGNVRWDEVDRQELTENEVSYVFKPHTPGRYIVTQMVNGEESDQSNAVEIVDIDKPYIVLNGPETIHLVWDEDFDPYYEKDNQFFNDPGAIADDYLQRDELYLSATLIDPLGKEVTIPGENEEIRGQIIKFKEQTKLSAPGTYKIIYNAHAPEPRLTAADPKERIIKLAPPKVINIQTGKAGEGIIKSDGGVYDYTETTVTLYNTYGQVVDKQTVKNKTSVTFTNVPVGLGYYLTQTVNGVESKPSVPVNVSLFADAMDNPLITSFTFKDGNKLIDGNTVIDHVTGTITVTVPHDTDLNNLDAEIETLNGDVTKPDKEHEFDVPLTYLVTINNENGTITKSYKVTVIKGAVLSVAKGTVSKQIANLSPLTQTITLNSSEKAVALEKGIAFTATDTAIFIPSGTVKETAVDTLAVKKLSNGAIDINWGSGNAPFVQPIELEIERSGTNKLAQVITKNGRTYSIIQPNEISNTSIISLVPQSGTYRFVNNITKPSLSKVTNTSYRLSTTESNATIYYSTKSTDISFEKSARSNSIIPNSYTLNASFDLSNWKIAQNNELVSAPNGEIFAFVMKNNVISPLEAVVYETPTEWPETIPTYSPSHIIKITFSSTVERKALYSDHIVVMDDTTGAKVKTSLYLSPDGKTIYVAPETAYTAGKQYTLIVNRQFKGNTASNEFLQSAITRTFKVK